MGGSCEVITSPVGLFLGRWCSFLPHFGYCPPLPEEGPLGTRSITLHRLGKVVRLVYGKGWTNKEYFGLLDPPLNGEGWVVVDQVVQTARSGMSIQAGCYVPEDGAVKVVVVAFRGMASRRGAFQAVDGRLLAGPIIRRAVKQAVAFCKLCRQRHPDWAMYVCGHSLGGFLAECVASLCGEQGVAFNNPGPWHSTWRNLTGRQRPPFEVHLTRGDPLRYALPKPENSAHIGRPIWHNGDSHRICRPYMCEVEDMRGVRQNDLPIDKTRTVVNDSDEEAHVELQV